jgi:hypothetical protein
VQPPQRAVVDGALGGGECGVKPPLVADLYRHPAACDGLGDTAALGGGRRDRLLAEGGQAAFDGGKRQRRVRRGAGGDDAAVDARPQ